MLEKGGFIKIYDKTLAKIIKQEFFKCSRWDCFQMGAIIYYR